MARGQGGLSRVRLSGRARGGAGARGCGADAQCAHSLLLHEPAPPQRQPTEEEKGDSDSVDNYCISDSTDLMKCKETYG